MLVNCVAYSRGAKLADIQVHEISKYLEQPETFVWVALKDPEPAEIEIMREEFNLHELAVEDARHGHQRPKIEEYGNSLFVVLQTIEFSSSLELNLGEVDIFVGSNYVLSVRNRTHQGFAAVRKRCETEPDLLKNGSAFVLYALIDTVVDWYFPSVALLEEALEQIEERIFSKSSHARSIVEELYVLKQKLVALQHAVSSLLDAVSKLHGARVPPICEGMEEYFRDVSDHVIRMTTTIESIRDMITTAIQVNLSLISLNESEVTKKLASYGALFAIPTAIAGIYGMNFKYMPELEVPWGYPTVVCAIILIDFFIWWKFRKTGWL